MFPALPQNHTLTVASRSSRGVLLPRWGPGEAGSRTHTDFVRWGSHRFNDLLRPLRVRANRCSNGLIYRRLLSGNCLARLEDKIVLIAGAAGAIGHAVAAAVQREGGVASATDLGGRARIDNGLDVTAETHGEKQKAFDRMYTVFRELHERVQKEGAAAKSAAGAPRPTPKPKTAAKPSSPAKP